VVAAPFDAIAPPGRHAVRWNGERPGGRDAEAGVYFVRLESGGAVRTARIVRLPGR